MQQVWKLRKELQESQDSCGRVKRSNMHLIQDLDAARALHQDGLLATDELRAACDDADSRLAVALANTARMQALGLHLTLYN